MTLATLVVALVARQANADHTITLPVSKISLSVPGSSGDWRVDGEGGFDNLTRLNPATPSLSMRLMIKPQVTDECVAALAEQQGQLAEQAELQADPPYVPGSFSPHAVETKADEENAATVCAKRDAGGIVLATITVKGAELASVASVVKPVLAGFLAGANGDAPAPSADEAGADESEPGVAVIAGPGSDTPSATEPSATVDPTELPPIAPGEPGEGPDEPAEPDDESEEPLGLGVEATVLSVAPETFSNTVGATGGIFSTFELLDTEYFGLNLHVNGAIGYNGDENWMGDVNVGVQPIVYFGPIGLSMVGGAGWDTISGSDEEVFKAPSAIYGFVGGRLGFSIVQAVGLIGGIDQLFRNDETVSDETRINAGLRFWFGGTLTYRALFRYIHYTGADALGGSVGIGF